jgi:hypothetical protein
LSKGRNWHYQGRVYFISRAIGRSLDEIAWENNV